MGKLQVSMGVCDYDRTRGLFDGRVQIEGCDVAAVNIEPEEAFHRAFGFQEFDISELSISSHTMMTSRGSNAYVGISKDFPRRLAKVIAGVEHEQVRCILSEQLYEELGGGELERTHRRLFLRLLEALGRWRPAELPEGAELPGEDLAARLEAIYGDPDPWVGVGAAIVIELLGKQVDLFVGAQFRRQQQLGDTSLEWLTLHEALEVDHAHESAVLAELVPVEHRAAAWRGGRRVFAAGWTYFDEMYALCFR